MFFQDGPGNGILLEGEKGQIFVSRRELTGAPIDAIRTSERDTSRLDEEAYKLYKGKRPTTHMENFIQCVRDRSEPIADVFTHHRAVSSCHMCNIALLLNRKLKWDPKIEDFIGDPEAGTMVARQQRKPYTIRT